LAHHLLFLPEELAALPSPAALLRHWPGWFEGWEGEPRLLDEFPPDSFNQVPAPTWPARAWQELTGDAGRAAGLLESDYVRGCYLECPTGPGPGLLDLICESLQLLNPDGRTPIRCWEHTFTTYCRPKTRPPIFDGEVAPLILP